VPLQCHMAGLSHRHLQHQAAAVVCNTAHDIKPAGCTSHQQLIIPPADMHTL
jgi:hypothetical protein